MMQMLAFRAAERKKQKKQQVQFEDIRHLFKWQQNRQNSLPLLNSRDEITN